MKYFIYEIKRIKFFFFEKYWKYKKLIYAIILIIKKLSLL